MDADTESTLQEYQIQLEQVGFSLFLLIQNKLLSKFYTNIQVELALRSDPDNEELKKLKEDLIVTSTHSNIFINKSILSLVII
jgi:hypothetical protein